MSNEKTLKTRIIHKHETEADWQRSSFVPKQAELIIYDTDENHSKPRIKIGDGSEKTINDLPFIGGGVGQETPEGGEIFNDYENNAAIGEGTSARGLNTQAGTFARKIVADGIKVLKDDDSSTYYQIIVNGLVNSDELCTDAWVATDNYVAGTSDLVTVDCKTHLSNALYISNIEENADTNTSTITIKRIDNRNFTGLSMDDISGTNMEEDWIYVAGKLNGEISPQFTSAFAGGKDSVATGYAAMSFGRANISAGNYSVTLGRGNKASYAGLAAGMYNEAGNGGIALGNSNKALGDAAVATGTNTYARAASSRAGGRESQALSEFSIADGMGVIAGLKQGQVVHGFYNVRNDSDLFIIGDGKSNTSRHNAFQITSDYKVFLNGGKIELADTERVDNLLYGSKTLNDTNNETSGTMALATGSGTTASGNYSFAGGVGSKATARSAVAIGEYNKATVQGGFAGGINAEANGFGTVALGYGVNTINSAPVYGQMAVGKFNLPNAYSLFMVGNGTSKEDRKNVFEVRKDGSAWLENQGTEPNAVVIKSELDSSIADVVSKLASAGLKREVVEALPETAEASDSTIYMVANNNENVEQNVYDEFMLINGNWETLGSTAVDLTSKPGEVTESAGAIFNDYENNKAVTPYGSAFGTKTQAGACGYHFTKLAYAEDLKTATVSVPKHWESEDTVYDVTSIGFVAKDIVNIDANSHQYEVFRITAITEQTDCFDITFEQVKRIETFGYNKYSWEVVNIDNSTLKLASDSLTDNWIWCTKKPNVGFPIPAFLGNFTAGRDNKALGYSTVALGRDNTAVGNHSTVFGRRNSAVGYVSLAGGFETIALSEQSVALGKQTVASGKRSMAINFYTRALGDDSFAGGSSNNAIGNKSFVFGNGSTAWYDGGIALGQSINTRKDLENHIVFGKLNRITTDYTTDDTIFAIGNGVDYNNRSNAFEIKEDGYAYVNNGRDKLATTKMVDEVQTSLNDVVNGLVVKRTESNGISINNNNAIGEGSIAGGSGNHAGTKAVKVLSIKSETEPTFSIAETATQLKDSFIIEDGAQPGIYWYDVYETTDHHGAPMTIYSLFSIDNDYTAYYNFDAGLDNSVFTDGGYYYIEYIPEDRIIESVKLATKTGDAETGIYTIKTRGYELSSKVKADDIIQLECKGTFNNSLKVVSASRSGDNTKLIVAPIEGVTINKALLTMDTNDTDNTKNWLYVLGKNVGEVTPRFKNAVALGKNSMATGYASLAIGEFNKAVGSYSVALGKSTVAGYNSFVFGTNSEANNGSIALGNSIKATGQCAFGSGSSTVASGNFSFASGVGSQATARSAVAMGEYNKATAQGGFAAGINTEANGFSTIALGYGVKTKNNYGQMAVGKFNKENTNSLFIVGNGTNKDNRNNAFEVKNDGSAWLQTQGTLPNSVVIKSYLDEALASINNGGGSSINNGQLILDGGLEIRTTNPDLEDNSPTYNYIKIGKNIDNDNPLEI